MRGRSLCPLHVWAVEARVNTGFSMDVAEWYVLRGVLVQSGESTTVFNFEIVST